jgi:mono/diheme cytochrome c family protein
MKTTLGILVSGLAVLALFACSRPAPAATTAPAAATTAPAATAATPAASDVEAKEEARPDSQKFGDAINLAGDVARGEKVYATSCVSCHGLKGVGNVQNAGSKDGSVPPLNPMDPEIASKDAKTYVKNIDVYMEHGSVPEGEKPSLTMPAFGDLKKLTPQQIADVIAYTITIAK